MSTADSTPRSESRERESEPILETTDLTKKFGSLVANDGIDFSVTDGEIRGLIGPNGSGKSTFFNTVSGFYKPTSGTVRFNGTDVTGWKPYAIAREGLARTFQITTPFEEMTVRDNLLAVPNDDDVDSRERAAEILEFLEIDHLADDLADEMSGGQQKLLELARILMLDPDCIMLDEPTAGVNPALQERILDHIREMNRQGTSFVIVEHDMDMIKQIADTVTVFDQGRVIAEGAFDDVKGDPRVREAYLGSADESESAESILEDASADEGTATPADTGDRLVATDVVTGYGKHEVVHGISMESRPGVTCIFGPNGSGKSTMLKSLNGLVPAWSGSVEYGDVDLTELAPREIARKGVATLPQEGGVLGDLTVKENLRVGALNVLDDDERIEENYRTVLEEFPILEEKLDDKARSLSGGQQMMVSFGRAMMLDADVYLLDEPTAGLAPSLVDDVFDLVQVLVDQGSHVILIEQNVRAAMRIADYVYILAQGDLQFEGTPSSLTNEDELIDLYLGI
ncbi:ATP-binding cassette domain-containing protein [Halopenitus salinus]|uniref:ATP-binding cassette domain-containing protein n=1 Tax=Halopenitus salinus TaxID=1198295 RepID=A0ABD5UQ83_9EURY